MRMPKSIDSAVTWSVTRLPAHLRQGVGTPSASGRCSRTSAVPLSQAGSRRGSADGGLDAAGEAGEAHLAADQSGA